MSSSSSSSSSSSQDQARILAERIARRISSTSTGEAARNTSREPKTTNDAGKVGEELAAVRAGLDELQHRLAHIESHLTTSAEETSVKEERAAPRAASVQQTARPQSSPFTAPPTTVHSPWLSGMYVPATEHPSQQRFGVEEAAVSELVDYFEREKTCNLEPGGKPCDHCAMCSSRGF